MNSNFQKLAIGFFLIACFYSGAIAATVTLKNPITAEDLEHQMLALSDRGGGVMRLPKNSTLTATLHTITYKNWSSAHGLLLVPEHVTLDLNGSTILLDLPENGYGIRLTSDTGIRNGTVRMIRNGPCRLTTIYHALVSVGCGYGDEGTPDNLSYFDTIQGWRIENLTLDQPFARACIQVMTGSTRGVIRNIRILDSPHCCDAIGFDWGTIGPIDMADAAQPEMGRLFEQKKIYSMHPHDILVQHVHIGRLPLSQSWGIRTSGCYRITIDDVEIDQAEDGIALHAGDAGLEYALKPEQDIRQTGYIVKNVKVHSAVRGIFIDGIADNIYRSVLHYGYHSRISSATPGIDHPIVKNVMVRGANPKAEDGILIQFSVGAKIENADVSEFPTGIRLREWVRNLTVSHSQIHDNTNAVWATYSKRKDLITPTGTEQKPKDILITHCRIYRNAKNIKGSEDGIQEVDDTFQE